MVSCGFGLVIAGLSSSRYGIDGHPLSDAFVLGIAGGSASGKVLAALIDSPTDPLADACRARNRARAGEHPDGRHLIASASPDRCRNFRRADSVSRTASTSGIQKKISNLRLPMNTTLIILTLSICLYLPL